MKPASWRKEEKKMIEGEVVRGTETAFQSARKDRLDRFPRLAQRAFLGFQAAMAELISKYAYFCARRHYVLVP